MTSQWDQHQIEGRLTAIFAEVHYVQPEHHFGRPYLSAYQLAIEFARPASAGSHRARPTDRR